MANPDNIKGQGFHTNPDRINKNGRPKGVENSKIRLTRLLELSQSKKNPVTGLLEDFTTAELMDMAVIAKALKGDVASYREVLDRLEGKVTQGIDHMNAGKEFPAPVIMTPLDANTTER